MSASVEIYTNDSDNTLSVPLIAVTAREDEDEDEKSKKDKEEEKGAGSKEVSKKNEVVKEIVFVVSSDTVGMREVKTGIQDNDYIEIVSGLTEGEPW
jgi:HlyD family secretion protein